MKSCFKCGKEKPQEDFYRNKGMRDGRVNKCKECTKADVRANRSKNIEYYREYDRMRGSRQDKAYRDEYRARFPKKAKAHNMVSNYIRDGKLQKVLSCECCGSKERIHAHHDDYNKPLDVRWLCAACHHQWHAENGEALNAR